MAVNFITGLIVSLMINLFYFRQVIITVKDVGSACTDGESRIQSQAAVNLVSEGVKKETDVNTAPDWGLIIGKSGAALVLHLVSGQYSTSAGQHQDGITLIPYACWVE